MDLGSYLRRARDEAGLTREAAVAEAKPHVKHVSTKSIGRWELGEAIPLDYAVWLAGRTQQTLDELFDRPPRTRPRSLIVVVDEEAWVARPLPQSRRGEDLEEIRRAMRASLGEDVPIRERRAPGTGS